MAQLNIVTSIHPLKLITQHIVGDLHKVESLFSINQDIHHAALKPSQMRMLVDADRLIWISDEFEVGMKKIHQNLPDTVYKLQLVNPTSEAHQDHLEDGHLWLSPQQAIRIGKAIAEFLSQLEPNHQQQYISNLNAYIDAVQVAEIGIINQFKTHNPKYIIDHDALKYFEQSFKTQKLGALSNHHHGQNSLKNMIKLNQIAKSGDVECFISSSAHPLTFAEKHQLKIINIDILGIQSNQFPDLLLNIAKALHNCRH